ncbi:MAG: E3 binding domain-containing protein, partial [Acidimicrobiales bacterium]
MATLIQMPKLGLTMTEGTITDWVADAGQKVAVGDVVMLIETDKVEAEVEAVADGVVHHTAAVGETLEPGQGVGWLLADDEAPPDGGPPPKSEMKQVEPSPATEPTTNGASPEASASREVDGSDSARIKASPNAKRVAAELAVDLALVVGTGPDGRITSEDVEAALPAGRGIGGRILASPNARRVAGLRGIDIATVVGTGPGGRITSEDVEAASDLPAPPQPAAAPESGASPSPVGSDRFVPFAASRAAQLLGVDIVEVTGTGPGGRVSRRDVYDHARRVGSTRAPVAAAASSVSPGDRIPVAGMRRVIAQRMHGSLQEMAQLTLSMDVDMDNAVQLRDQLKEIGADELGVVPGYTDMVIAA